MSNNRNLLKLAIIGFVFLILGSIVLWVVTQRNHTPTQTLEALGAFLFGLSLTMIIFVSSLLGKAFISFWNLLRHHLEGWILVRSTKPNRQKIKITVQIEGESITIESDDVEDATKILEQFAILQPKVSEQDKI